MLTPLPQRYRISERVLPSRGQKSHCRRWVVLCGAGLRSLLPSCNQTSVLQWATRCLQGLGLLTIRSERELEPWCELTRAWSFTPCRIQERPSQIRT